MESSASHALPDAARHRFVVGSIMIWGAWVLAGWWGLRVAVHPGWVMATALLPLAVLRRWERRLRHMHLPVQGWQTWCCRGYLGICVLAGAAGWLGARYGHWLPRVVENSYHGSSTVVFAPTATSPEPTVFAVEYESTGIYTGWAPSSWPPCFDHESGPLHFRAVGRPGAPGWSIQHRAPTLVRDDGIQVHEWTEQGVVKMAENLAGHPVPHPLDKVALLKEYEEITYGWDARCGSFPHFTDTGHSRPALSIIRDPHWTRRFAPWVEPVFAGGVFALFTLAAGTLARTMGGPHLSSGTRKFSESTDDHG